MGTPGRFALYSTYIRALVILLLVSAWFITIWRSPYRIETGFVSGSYPEDKRYPIANQ